MIKFKVKISSNIVVINVIIIIINVIKLIVIWVNGIGNNFVIIVW